MIGTPMYTTILTLYKQGLSQRKIARTTNTHRTTVKKIIDRYESSQIETPIPYIPITNESIEILMIPRI
jgi:DNA invertase Pin-like site-specific DNA recombinase